MSWEIIFKLIVLGGGGFFTIVFAAIALKLLFTNSYDYNKIHKISGPLSSVIRGSSSTFHNGYRDHRKKAGLAINTKTNEWIEQGTLSDDSLDSIFRS